MIFEFTKIILEILMMFISIEQTPLRYRIHNMNAWKRSGMIIMLK